MIELNMQSVEVKSEVRQIRATWTPEMAKDLNSYHSIDLEDALRSEMRKEMRKNKIEKIFN
jgi:hypothetical protein